MRKQSGFTLIELLITMVVVGILAAIAIPNFKLTVQNNRLVTQSNDILGSLIYARSMAITIDNNASFPPHYVTICASSNGTSCSGSTNWQNGWIVQGYTAAVGAVSNASGTVANRVLRAYPGFTNTNTLNGAAVGSSITFYKDGTIPAGVGGNSFILCDTRGKTYARSIYLYVNGEARISPTAGKNLDGSTITAC